MTGLKFVINFIVIFEVIKNQDINCVFLIIIRYREEPNSALKIESKMSYKHTVSRLLLARYGN